MHFIGFTGLHVSPYVVVLCLFLFVCVLCFVRFSSSSSFFFFFFFFFAGGFKKKNVLPSHLGKPLAVFG